MKKIDRRERAYRTLSRMVAKMKSEEIREAMATETKQAQLNFRLRQTDLESIRQTAGEMDVSISDYLVTLHKLTRERLSVEGKK